jgi:photosystem II stability/assembly factor-like uncharacterized protein
MSKISLKILMFATIVLSCNKEPNGTEDKTTFNTIDKDTVSLNGWEVYNSRYDFSINSRDTYFLNSYIGFVVGYNGDIYKTIDSGKTWIKKNSGTTLHLHSIFFLNEDVGFASSQAMNCLSPDCNKGSVLLKTTDGGDTWIKYFFPNYYRILSLKFFNESEGIAIIYTPGQLDSIKENVAITSDGGISWNFIDLAIRPGSDKLFFVNNLIYIAGKNHNIFTSTDHGNTWETINTPGEANHSVRNFYFINENLGIVDVVPYVYETTDGGSNWIKTNIQFTTVGTVHFCNENEGFNIEPVWAYEGGDFPTFKGSIYYETKDGGLTWSKSEIIKALHLGPTYFLDNEAGYGFYGSEFYAIKKKE